MIQLYLQLIDTETDKEKFEALYDQYRRLMHKIADDLLHDKHLAEDAVHEAFLRIIKCFHKIGEIDCPETKNFLVIIVRNVALNMIEKDKHRPQMQEIHNAYAENDAAEASGMPWENFSSGIDETADEVLRKEILATVSSLPDWAADVLALSAIYGCSSKEIAVIEGISNETARKRLQRARSLFKDMMQEGKRGN